MIGTTMALIGMAAATAGSKVVASKIQSNAANKAAKTQVAAAGQAGDFLKQIYGQQQQMQAPYIAQGQRATALLGDLMTPNPGARMSAPPMAVNRHPVWGV